MTRHAKALLITAVALLVQSLPSAAKDESKECPPSIETTQAASDPIPDGWSAYGAKDRQPLIGVSFFLGPPDQNALIAPTREQRKGKKIVATWIFPISETGYWVACEYAKTTVVVARRLQSDARVCSVEFDGSFSTPVARAWNCRPSPSH